MGAPSKSNSRGTSILRYYNAAEMVRVEAEQDSLYIDSRLKKFRYNEFRSDVLLYLPEIIENIVRAGGYSTQASISAQVLAHCGYMARRPLREVEDIAVDKSILKITTWLRKLPLNCLRLLSLEQVKFLSSLCLFVRDWASYKYLRVHVLGQKASLDNRFVAEYDTDHLNENSFADDLLVSVMCGLYAGNRQSYIDFFKKNKDEEFYFNDDYNKFLRGKSVAIVGPVDVGLENGQEIDAYDVVVRFNFKGIENYDSTKFGSKTNISYYIKSDLKVALESNAEAVNELTYVVYPEMAQDVVDKYSDKIAPNCISRLHVHKKQFCPFLHGAPNAIQKALLDLLRYECGPIKVFNANIFVDNNKLVSSYRESSKHPKFMNMTYHDPVSNFVFMKKLFASNVYEADNILESVLTLSSASYVDRISYL